MSLQGTLALLSNFSHTVDADRRVYEFFEKRLNIPEYRRMLQEIAKDTPQDTDGQSDLERERTRLGRMLVEAEFENAELELTVLALDLKISLIAQRVQEPFPGFFTQVGITPHYRLLRQSQPQDRKSRLKLVKK